MQTVIAESDAEPEGWTREEDLTEEVVTMVVTALYTGNERFCLK